MTEKEKYILSTYQSDSVIRETAEVTVEAVICSLDGKKYIRKTYHSDKRRVFNILAGIKNVHIPKIYEVIFGEDTVIIEQYIEGKTMEQLISEGKMFDKKQIKAVFDSLTDAVDTLHKNGLVHRDIKPSNMIISDNGGAVLIDYSIARPYSDKRSADTELFGTVGYAAPEQFGFSQSDFRTDIYALGVTMKEITNRHNSSERMRNAISRCTEFDPSRRFQSIAELRSYLDKGRKQWIVIAAAGLTAALAGAALCFSLYPAGTEDTLTADVGTNSLTQQILVSERETAVAEEIQSEAVISSESEQAVQTSETEAAVSETEETADTVSYELYYSEIVSVPYYEEGVLCIRMWYDGAYEAEIPLGEDIPPVKIAAEKSGSSCTVTVNGEEFSFEDTFVPGAYSYQDSSKVAELVFYDMNGDGILDILPFISDALIVEYSDGQALRENYTSAWCIYSDEQGNYKLAEGEMNAYPEHFSIYESSPGILWSDFPTYYKLENGSMILHY
ncbi:MAG: protein kinase [Oscillospiraceae bacterium]|nr:protein kinase [Oscillospiraceae bacterium]